MSSEFNKPVSLVDLLNAININNSLSQKIMINSFSDSNIGGVNSICCYIKGVIPENYDNQWIFVKEEIDGYNCIVDEDPQGKLIELINYISHGIGFKQQYKDIDNGKNIRIGQNCVIEDDVYIGDNTVIEHNVVIHNGTSIGNNCIIRSGATIGGEGYGFVKRVDGTLARQPFIGRTIIEDNVEVGYNTAIVKGTIGDTYISHGAKLDNLIHVAHDCHIGEDSTVTAGVSLCGYVTLGKRTRLAPNSTVKQRLNVGDDVVVGLGAVVVKSVEGGEVVAGNPAKPLRRIGTK